ncbi:MAG: stage II sporulation protein M [Oscillospiraceae bacterium]|nr:stage II sporulation protein M [Oscillospiraceae bacterium]
MDTIKSEYALMFKFLKSIRKQLLILALLFVVIAVIAYFAMGSLYQTQPEVIEEHIGELAEMLNTKDIIDEAGKMDAIKLFFGNFYAAMAAVSYGMIPFLFLPALSLLTNAAVIGVITAIFKAKEIGGVIDTLVGILPHGIFEIPALLLCVAFGLNLSLLGTRILRRKASKYDLYEFSAETARALVLAVVPLLIAAAVVESYITPIIMDAFIL